MDEGEFKLVIKELKDKGFIDKNRRFCKSNLAKYPTGFRGKLGVLYYPESLQYYSRNDICFILLHEEYHCVSNEINPVGSERNANQYAKDKITNFDNTINLELFISELNAHIKEYRESIPKLTKVQEKIFSIKEHIVFEYNILMNRVECFN